MLEKLIPWKKNVGDVKVRHDNSSLARFRQEFDELWDRFWSDSSFPSSGMDMDDNEKEYVVRAEIPGFDVNEIDVNVSGNVLTLSAERSEECTESNGSYKRHGSFQQSLTLPQGVLADQVEASYQNGVLELHLPKSEECKPKRIAVKSK